VKHPTVKFRDLASTLCMRQANGQQSTLTSEVQPGLLAVGSDASDDEALEGSDDSSASEGEDSDGVREPERSEQPTCRKNYHAEPGGEFVVSGTVNLDTA
jgi:hypothetical protein